MSAGKEQLNLGEDIAEPILPRGRRPFHDPAACAFLRSPEKRDRAVSRIPAGDRNSTIKENDLALQRRVPIVVPSWTAPIESNKTDAV